MYSQASLDEGDLRFHAIIGRMWPTLRLEVTMQLLGLNDTRDTLIGNALIR
jgi:hypothetical protein